MSRVTDARLRAAKPRARAYKIGCGDGLYLLVNPSGSKLWRQKYRHAGRERLLSYGPYPKTTLRQARLRALEAKELIADGIDPRAQERAQEAQERQQQAAAALTFGEVAERWYSGNAELAVRPWSESTARRARMYLDKDILPRLGHRPIAEITRPELIAFNERVERRGAFEVARKMRAWLAAIFDLVYDTGEIPHNPAIGLKPSFYAKGREQKHHAFIAADELPAMLEAVEESGAHILLRLALRMIIYTACRTGELRLATWAEFDLDEAVWTVPGERTKQRRPLTLPLPRQAVEILHTVAAINPEGHLWIIKGGKPFSNMAINQMLRRAGYGGRATGHGMRHTTSTALHEAGYPHDHIEHQLGHKVGRGTVRGVYNHAEYLEQRRAMMQAWADQLDKKEH